MKHRSIVNAIAFALLIAPNLHSVTFICPVPQVKRYYSHSKGYYFEVIPRKNNDSYAKGTLYKLGANEKYHQVWSIRLSNEVAPNFVLVSNKGDYVVTLDNWCDAGRGDNVVVIYSSKGELVRKFALGEVASKEERNKFDATADGIWWGGDHFLDDGSKVLDLKIKTGNFIFVSDAKPSYRVREYRTVRIDLRTGGIVNS